jgi:hypothetical protein
MQEKMARRTFIGCAGLIAGSAITATLPELSAVANPLQRGTQINDL